jgi:RimJ/RimL family protein N-acetyltransferase
MADNHAMQHICRKVGFKLEHSIAGHDFVAEYVL